MSDWNTGYLNIRKMHNIYLFYLESSMLLDFDNWLRFKTQFSEYQIKRLLKFQKTDYAKNILFSHSWD